MSKVDEYLRRIEELQDRLQHGSWNALQSGVQLRKAVQALQRKCSSYSVRSVPVLSADDIERILERELLGREE